MKYPQHLQKVIENLKRLPGVGAKSAERFAFQMIDWSEDQLRGFGHVISQIPEQVIRCPDCGCIMDQTTCCYCEPRRFEAKKLCVIASPKDVFAIEEIGEFRGAYHVIENLLSPLEGKGPESLNLLKLRNRIESHALEEVILALDSTLEGDATSLYIKKELESLPVKISRLAFGLPMGSSFDYVDGGTLAKAFTCRGAF